MEKLIKPDKYQVFLMASPASIPINFASHCWLVINKKGIISRWDVKWRPQDYNSKTKWGHLSLDILPPFQGLRIFHFLNKYYWKSSLVKLIEGDEESLASQMVKFIEQSPQAYPYKDSYSFFSPNSNTYVQWVINHFPQSDMHLPWNAFGKRNI